jgi:hypothetical protein
MGNDDDHRSRRGRPVTDLPRVAHTLFLLHHPPTLDPPPHVGPKDLGGVGLSVS